MSHHLKNKNNAHIVVNDSISPILKLEENNKQCTTCDVKRADIESRFQHITWKPIKIILHAIDNKI